MRELKFRVYIPDHDRLEYFDLNNFDYSDRYLNDSEHPVQQYTGVKDKNNKEIYEGDIVKTIYANDSCLNLGIVIYHVETGTYRIKTSKQLLPIVTYRFIEDKPQGLLRVAEEVIGNIYDLPCEKPNGIDHNGECIHCDSWVTDCSFDKFK